MNNHFGTTVTSMKRLREVLPPPPPGTITTLKVLDHMDSQVRKFIAHSPYVILASAGSDGSCDASPRGGTPGFVCVLDEKRLLIGEATGNRRADTLVNLMTNPYIGMLFLIPGYEEVLRINGQAVVTEDASLLSQCENVNGYAPKLGIGIEVEECHLHCAKAAIRSSIWNPLGWPDLQGFPTAAEIFQAHTASKIGDGSVKEIQMMLNDGYINRL